MKKLNHIWIFSDSILGHEIQSQALASKIANITLLFHCGLRQPWLSFAPRILPRFGKNILWENQKPDCQNPPDAIITCGRRMAAVGKYYTNLTGCKHIQILNPADNPKNYDVIVSPEHDNMQARNVITSKGSLHGLSPSSLEQQKMTCENDSQFANKKIISLLIGCPAKPFFNQLDQLYNQIRQHYPNHKLHVCGSRRTAGKFHNKIRLSFKNAQSCWLNETDGKNPYLCLLACSDVLLVTSDSINMVSEACATENTVIALAQNNISPKHKRFVHSMQNRLSEFGNIQGKPIPFDTLTHVSQQVILALKD